MRMHVNVELERGAMRDGKHLLLSLYTGQVPTPMPSNCDERYSYQLSLVLHLSCREQLQAFNAATAMIAITV
jgi:hypothetical protein